MSDIAANANPTAVRFKMSFIVPFLLVNRSGTLCAPTFHPAN